MSLPLPTMPPEGFTVDDLEAMPESHIRLELTDGALTVSPSPSSLHQAVAARLCVGLDAVLPPGLAATQAVEIRFAPKLTRIPDVLVVRSSEPERHWFAPREVLLAVEIESPNSQIEDRITKPALYARFGIPHYWRVEVEPVLAVTLSTLAGDAYTTEPRSDRVQISDPFPFTVTLADLLPRWAR